MLLAPLAVLGLPGCFGKFTEHFRQRGQLLSFISRIGWASVGMTLLLAGTIIAFPQQFAFWLFGDVDQTALVQFLGAALVLVSASNFFGALMESLCQVRTVTIMRFITGLAFAVIGVSMLMLWEDGASAAATAYTISCFLGLIPAFWILWKYRTGIYNSGDPLTHAAMWRRIAPFAIWLWVSNLMNNLFEVSDRYMLIHWSSMESDLAQGAVGQYHSGRVVPLLLVSLAIMLGGLLMPYLSKFWESGEKAAVRIQLNWSVKLVSLSFTGAGVLTLLLSPVLFDWILQGRYNDGLAVFPMTLVYCIWYSIMVVAQDYLWVAEKGKWAAVSNAAALAVNILLNMLLIPLIGLHGAVIATSLGNLALLVLIFYLNHRFGCRTNIGIWLCAALPLVLLLSKPFAVIAFAAAVIASLWSNLIFSSSEKLATWQLLKEKLGNLRPNN